MPDRLAVVSVCARAYIRACASRVQTCPRGIR